MNIVNGLLIAIGVLIALSFIDKPGTGDILIAALGTLLACYGAWRLE
jgi:hypothetical protein